MRQIWCGCLWHAHRIQNKKVGKTLILNPGTANGWFIGYDATAAIFDTQRTILNLDKLITTGNPDHVPLFLVKIQ